VVADDERLWSRSSMTRLPQLRPSWRSRTYIRATKCASQGILRGRNIQDQAASAAVPRLARATRALCLHKPAIVSCDARADNWKIGAFMWPCEDLPMVPSQPSLPTNRAFVVQSRA
jgi:hypothetical protein